MVSRQETARPLLTPGEVMQLPPNDEIVMLAGINPARAKKVRYYEDKELQTRILPAPKLISSDINDGERSKAPGGTTWAETIALPEPSKGDDPDNGGLRREPELPQHEEVAPKPPDPAKEFELGGDEPDDEAPRLKVMHDQVRDLARQTSLDPADHMGL
jgi:type IV secretion system protein VirD4